jgi:hypothetical protein
LNPGLGLLRGTSELSAGRNLSETSANIIFHGIEHRNTRVFRTFMLKNLQKVPFGEGQVQDPIPAPPGHGSKIPAALLGDR